MTHFLSRGGGHLVLRISVSRLVGDSDGFDFDASRVAGDSQRGDTDIRPRRSDRLSNQSAGCSRTAGKNRVGGRRAAAAALLNAGLRGSGPAEKYFAAQMLGPVAAIALASFIRSNTFIWVAGLATLAYLAPDFWLDHAVKARRERIRRSVPDAVDLLVICVDAGLGLDQAMLRVGVELSISHPEINEEFLQINREQRAGKPRMDAWQSMADRTTARNRVLYQHVVADGKIRDPDRSRLERICRWNATGASPARGRTGRQDDRQNDLSAGAVYFSQHVYRAAGAGSVEYRPRSGRIGTLRRLTFPHHRGWGGTEEFAGSPAERRKTRWICP